jgi:voltage-gated potassium channel
MRALVRPLILLQILFVAGVIGYMLIEHWPFLDALYMVAITLSTVGFSEVREVSDAGRIFTVCLILFGISIGGYLLTRIGELLIELQIKGITRRRHMQKQIRELDDHYIVCGFGRVGKQICEEFVRDGQIFVVVEQKASCEPDLIELGYLYLLGDATDDDTLLAAGIQRARGIVVAVDSDADSIFVTLSARSLNASIFIVSEARESESERKLRRAGASRVVSPFLIAGRRMAHMLARPHTVEFLDTVVRRSGDELKLEEVTIREETEIAGITLASANLRRRSGVMVLAIVQANGETVFNPDADTELRAGQMLIVLGTDAQLQALRKVV